VYHYAYYKEYLMGIKSQYKCQDKLQIYNHFIHPDKYLCNKGNMNNSSRMQHKCDWRWSIRWDQYWNFKSQLTLKLTLHIKNQHVQKMSLWQHRLSYLEAILWRLLLILSTFISWRYKKTPRQSYLCDFWNILSLSYITLRGFWYRFALLLAAKAR